MKKLCLFLFITILIIASYLNGNCSNIDEFFSLISCGQMLVYANNQCPNLEYIDAGTFKIYKCNKNSYLKYKDNFDAVGLCFILDSDEVNIEKIIEKFDIKIINKSLLDNLIVFDCFIKEFEKTNIEEKINMQIAISDEKIKIGFPRIFDSF